MVHYFHNTDIPIHIFNGNLFPPDYLKSKIMEHDIKSPLYQMFLNPKPWMLTSEFYSKRREETFNCFQYKRFMIQI